MAHGDPSNESAKAQTANFRRIGVDEALSKINIIDYQWPDRIRGISSSDVDADYVKDVLYAIWLSGYDCEAITGMQYTIGDTIRKSISRQMDKPKLALIIGLPGVYLGASKEDHLTSLIDQGDIPLARRFIFEQIAPLFQAGEQDVAALDGRGATVTCGDFRYRVATSLGSSGILVAAPL